MMNSSDVSSSQIIYHADAQRELEQRARGLAQRKQEVGQRHGEAVNTSNDTSTRNMLRSALTIYEECQKQNHYKMMYQKKS